jgi:hypothetical protein
VGRPKSSGAQLHVRLAKGLRDAAADEAARKGLKNVNQAVRLLLHGFITGRVNLPERNSNGR